MTTVKRSVLALALLLMISLPLTLFLYLRVQQMVVRKEMDEKLKRTGLQTLRLAVSEVHWYEENREIIVDGTMFDVLSQKPVPGTDTIEFTGLYDHKETEIVRRIGRVAHKNKDNEPADMPEITALYLLLYAPEQFTTVSSGCYCFSIPFAPYKIGGWPSADLSIPTPPPKTFTT